MASAKRVQCWLLLFVFLRFVGYMEATRWAPNSAILFDSRTDDANGNGTSIHGVRESQSVPKQDMDEEGRILLASGNDMMSSSTMDYGPPGSNHDHDPPRGGGHHPHLNANGAKN